jgi:hypothetical protein
MANPSTAIELTASHITAPERSPTMSLDRPSPTLKKGTTAIIFASITAVTGIYAIISGIVVIALPKMAKDLDISDSLLLW